MWPRRSGPKITTQLQGFPPTETDSKNKQQQLVRAETCAKQVSQATQHVPTQHCSPESLQVRKLCCLPIAVASENETMRTFNLLALINTVEEFVNRFALFQSKAKKVHLHSTNHPLTPSQPTQDQFLTLSSQSPHRSPRLLGRLKKARRFSLRNASLTTRPVIASKCSKGI